MANIGIGETYVATLTHKVPLVNVDSFIGDTVPVVMGNMASLIDGPSTDFVISTVSYNGESGEIFKYRYLSQFEMTNFPISAWLKNKYESVIFTSETEIIFKQNDTVVTEDGKKHLIEKVTPVSSHGAFIFTKRPPHILELG